MYCLIRALSGSVRMRTKSCSVSESSSTRMGNRPWNSGIRPEGLDEWNAHAEINRIWSVLTMPYRVLMEDPSTIGNKSRCTPSRDTSGP